MKRALLTSFLAVTTCVTPALADDFIGNVELEGKIADVSGNKSKFNEYRDLGTGATGSVLLDWANDKGYYLYFSGKNFGYNADARRPQNDQQFYVKGGLQESFKYSLFYNETPHNLSLGARSSYLGIGSTALTSTLANNATTSAANLIQYFNKPAFDYSVNRQDYGAEAEFSFNSPFFFNTRFEHNDTNGLLPIGTYAGALKELPAPINYTSNNIYLTTGYRSNDLIVTLDGTISDFTNANSSFVYGYTNASAAANSTYRTYLAPDSTNYKVGGNFMYRAPFWNTTFMARASHSISTNTIGLNEEANTHFINQFDGKLTYTTLSAAITSSPIKLLDIKLYLNYLDKQNQSTAPFAYYTGTFNAATGVTEKFSYHKLNAGLDLSVKLPAKTKLSAGYEYLQINRTIGEPVATNTSSWGFRNDAPKTTDNILYLQAKNDLFDWLSAKVRYQRMYRTSDFAGDVFAAFNDNRQIKAFWRPADTADKTQDMVKVGVELEPLHNLTFGAEYKFKNNNYTKSILGMQGETAHELYLDANVKVAMVKLNPYFEYEIGDNDSKHRRYQTVGAASPYSTVNDANNYNWTSKRNDTSYAFGINGDIDIIKEKLSFTTGYRYENAKGKEDFTTTFNPATPMVNNTAVDNYTKQSFTARFKYNLTKNLNIGLAYLFENLRYSDNHYDNYSYITTATTGAGNLLTGAYANPNYDAHVGYMTVGYKF